MTIRDNLRLALQVLASEHNGVVMENNDVLGLFIRIGEGMVIEFDFLNDPDRSPRCSTKYTAKGKEYTFDRLGVEDSFYYRGLAELPFQVQAQISRVLASQKRLENMTEFNFGPCRRMVDKETLEQIVNELKAGRMYQFYPAGFGIGYVFSTDPKNSNRFERHLKASAELVNLVGRPLYIHSVDCD